jgi:hypothetical protein
MFIHSTELYSFITRRSLAKQTFQLQKQMEGERERERERERENERTND